MRQESFLSSIGSAVFWKGLDRLAGLAKHIIIAAAIGLSAQLDVFYMMLALLGVLVFSWATMIDVVAVPSMVRAWQDGKQDDFKEISSGLLSLTLLISLLLALILYFGKDIFAGVAVGFDAERRKMLADAIPWLLPVILLYIPLRFLGAVLRSIRKFSAFYQAEFLTALAVLMCVWAFRQDEHVLLWSFSAGISIAFVFLLLLTKEFVFPLGNPGSQLVRKSLQLAPGLLVLQGAQYVYVLTDRIFVSFLPAGSVSGLAYALTLVSLLPGLVSLSGGFITVIAEKQAVKERCGYFNSLLSMGIYAGSGVTFFLLMAGPHMVQTLLERGMFSDADTYTVATAITAYAWMAIPLFLIGPLDQIFQVESQIGFMVKRTVFGLLTNAILSAWFLFGLKWGLFGIALATSISYWVMLAAGLSGLKNLRYEINWFDHLKWILWISSFLAATKIMYSLFLDDFISGIYSLVSVSFILGGVLLFCGAIYPKEEGALIRSTFIRILEKRKN